MTTAHDGDRELEWTGERYVPELPGNIRLEHVHRYLLARELAKGRRVLDIACGEGYGSDLLASVAAQVIGIDIIPSVVQHAHRRYRRPHLDFVAGSCTAIPLAAQSVDAVVSFETLEHHDRHDEMMREVRRVLRPGGLLIISSPDRREYSDVPGYQNPFHVRELYRDEFETLLAAHFRSVSLVGQRVHAGSIVGPLDATAETAFLSFGGTDRADRSFEGLRAPLYLIGVATDGERPRIPVGLLDGGDFVWSRDHIRDTAEQVERSTAHEAVASALRAELDRQTAVVVSLAADKGKAEERAGWLQEEIDRRGARIGELDTALMQLHLISAEAHRALDEARRQTTEAHRALEEARRQTTEAHRALEEARRQTTEAHRALEEARTQVTETRAEFHKAQEAGREQEATLAAALADHHKVRVDLESRLTGMENSHSWRLTAPLRGVRQRLKDIASRMRPGQLQHPPHETAALAEPATAEPAVSGDAPQPEGAERPPVPLQETVDAARPPRPRERESIVVVSHDAHFYGAQRVALFLARTLSRDMGYDVEILLCGEGPLRQEFAAAGRVHDFYSETSTPDVQARIIADLYDHGARLALCNTSCVGDTVHALKAAGFTIVSLIHELPGLIGQYGLEHSIATIARDADKVVFGAELVRDRFVEMTGLAPAKTVVRPQGLLTRNRYSGRRAEARHELRARLGVDEHIKIAVAVGSAHRRKGPDLFVNVGLAVMERRDDVVFVWVGHTDGDGFAEASALVAGAGAGAEARFFFPGVIEDSDVFFAGADVYLMTSREDPFPSVVLHALDAELPVIGFDHAGGFVEVLRRDCGQLVPYLDTDAMAAAVLHLLAHPSEGLRLSAIGKEIVSREFEWTRYVHDLVMLAQGPRVSVIVPNYNYAHHLPARLRSILTQTYRPYEIIFLDDCSSDTSLEVAEGLLGHGGIPFRIIRNDRNQGVYRQWLRGLQEATGDLVWIAEADDDCSSRLLERLVPAFANLDVVLAYCQSQQVDDTGRQIAPDYLGWTADVDDTKWRQPYVRRGTDEVRDSLAVKNTIPNASAVVMRKPDLTAIESVLLGLRNAGDWLVYVHALERGAIAFVPEPLNSHRRHNASVTIGQGGLNLMRETLFVQRYVLDRHEISSEVQGKREAHLQATYEYLGLNKDGPASYKDHEALRPLTAVAG